jgi:Ca2+-binding RTX toxin-like protein
MYGEDGNDLLEGGDGADYFDCGDGLDVNRL